MSGAETYPEFDPSAHEKMALMALVLNIHEMSWSARRLNDEYIRSMRKEGRSFAHRYVMTEVPSRSAPVSSHAVSVNNERIVLIDDTVPTAEAQRLIVRIPLSPEVVPEPGTPQDTFIERVPANADRQRFLLNNDGLWRYGDATDVVPVAEGSYRVLGQTEPEPATTVEQMSRDIAQYGFWQQTRFDISV